MNKVFVEVRIPRGTEFTDLEIRREGDGSVSFNMDVIAKVLEHSGVPMRMFTKTGEINVIRFLVNWYKVHLERGGDPDPVIEDLFLEKELESKAGQHYSFPPGRA